MMPFIISNLPTLRGLVFHERRLMAINSEQTFEELWNDVTVTLPSSAHCTENLFSDRPGSLLSPSYGSAVRCRGFRGTTS